MKRDSLNFGLGAPSICARYPRRLATANVSSLEDPLMWHCTVTLNLLAKKMAHIHGLTKGFLTTWEGTKLHIRQQLSCCMRLLKLMSIYPSKLHLIKQAYTNEALSLYKPLPSLP